MNFINPIGRSIGDGNHINACMCYSNKSFASGKGSSDTCAYCGCRCKSNWDYNAGNNVSASFTFRKS